MSYTTTFQDLTRRLHIDLCRVSTVLCR
ncbi:putative leader peptide [Glycomyces sp. NPDC049804]